MRSLLTVTSRALVALALLLSGLVSVVAAAPAQAATPSASALSSYESTVITAINWQRRHHGLKAVKAATCVDRYAESLAAKLRSSSTLKHQSMSTVMNGCHGTMASENIARGHVSPKTVLNMWMNSPGHRANVLDPRLTEVGVGTTYSSSLGYTTVATFIRR